jgi:hypothetical protein
VPLSPVSMLFGSTPAVRESPPSPSSGGFKVIPGDVLLSRIVSRLVPSVLEGLTSVFGVGTGVAPPLWPPGNTCAITQFPHIYAGRQKSTGFLQVLSEEASRPISTARLNALPRLHLQPVKLVVSEWPYGTLRSGKSNLGVGFALRCFQRLSWSEHSYPAMPPAEQLIADLVVRRAFDLGTDVGLRKTLFSKTEPEPLRARVSSILRCRCGNEGAWPISLAFRVGEMRIPLGLAARRHGACFVLSAGGAHLLLLGRPGDRAQADAIDQLHQQPPAHDERPLRDLKGPDKRVTASPSRSYILQKWQPGACILVSQPHVPKKTEPSEPLPEGVRRTHTRGCRREWG